MSPPEGPFGPQKESLNFVKTIRIKLPILLAQTTPKVYWGRGDSLVIPGEAALCVNTPHARPERLIFAISSLYLRHIFASRDPSRNLPRNASECRPPIRRCWGLAWSPGGYGWSLLLTPG